MRLVSRRPRRSWGDWTSARRPSLDGLVHRLPRACASTTGIAGRVAARVHVDRARTQIRALRELDLVVVAVEFIGGAGLRGVLGRGEIAPRGKRREKADGERRAQHRRCHRNARARRANARRRSKGRRTAGHRDAGDSRWPSDWPRPGTFPVCSGELGPHSSETVRRVSGVTSRMSAGRTRAATLLVPSTGTPVRSIPRRRRKPPFAGSGPEQVNLPARS
jgi:hypothetical protein